MSKRTFKNCQYISDETVSELNDQHGWFQYEDAQSDVSRAFANNAVHAFLEIAKDAEQAKQETGMTPMELVSQIYDLKARIAELEKDARRWRAATRDMEINDIAVYCIDKYGYDRIVVGDEADAAIDTAMQKD